MRNSVSALATALLLLGSWSHGSQANEYRIVGTGDGLELISILGAAYTADHPGRAVIVPPSIGSGGGIAAVGSEKELLGRVARRLSEAEKILGLVETPIFRLPTVFYVHPSAGVHELATKQLAAIYSGKIRNWKHVGGADLRIKLVRREEDDSSLRVLRDSMPGWKDLEITHRSKTAVTTQESADTVRRVKGAIGFGAYNKSLEPDMVVLAIDGRHPTEAGYPSAVTVSYIHKDSTVTPEARSIVSYALSKKGRTLLSSMGGVPISR